MREHRNPRPSLSRPFPDKFDPTASHDDVPGGPLADPIDAIGHGLTESLGDAHLIATPVPSARSTFALDVVPELVAPEAPTASTDDESPRPHVRQLRATHRRRCQRVARLRRPAHRRQRLGVAKVLTTSGTKQEETGWGRFTIAAVLLALLGVLSLLVLGACQVDTAASGTVIHTHAVLPGASFASDATEGL